MISHPPTLNEVTYMSNMASSEAPMDARRVFETALSSASTHNYLVAAFRNAGMAAKLPRDHMWDIPVRQIPIKVRRLLNAEVVVADIRLEIDRAREAIESMHTELDRVFKRTVTHTPDVPYDNLHPSIVTTRRPATREWCYTFNAYHLAMALLDGYERFINNVMHWAWLPTYTQIARICEKAKRMHNSVALIADEMRVLLATQ